MAGRFRQMLDDGEVIIFDGAMGTMLFEHGIFINRCFDELNLSNPGLVASIHERYVKAGAMVLETNTFGANRFKLSSHGLGDKTAEINRAGARIARDAAGSGAIVAGSVGPLGLRIEPWGPTSLEEAKEAFKEQITALVEGGCELIVLETFADLAEIGQAIAAVMDVRRERAIDLPVVASMTVDESGQSLYGTPPDVFGPKIESWGADVLGLNCSVGPKSMLDTLEKLRGVTTAPLSVMPNAGLPTEIEGRTIYVCSPDYMAGYARRFVQVGARIIGGCCGTTPEHISKIADSLRQVGSEARSLSTRRSSVAPPPAQTAEPIPLAERSSLAAKVASGEFVALVELSPPSGWGLSRIVKSAQKAKEAGFDAVNVPDGPRAMARMGPMAMAVVVERDVGIETVMHYACRDRNLLGMQSDILGAYALGLRNVLLITGDPPILGDYPHATAVFDVDSIGLTNMVTRLNQGVDLGGRSIGKPTGFLVFVGLNPTAINPDKELGRFRWKVEAGAHVAITQPVFDPDQLIGFLDAVDAAGLDIPVIAGLWPLQSLRNAEFLANEVPGVSIPKEVLGRMERAKRENNEVEEGERIALEIFSRIRHRVRGLQISAPFGKIGSAVRVLSSARAILSS